MDAPEKIWATGNAHYGSWNSIEVRNADHQVEYTRTDRVNELVAAAYERAEVACQIEIDRAEKHGNLSWADSAKNCKKAIRSLTPADATAA